MRTSEDPETEIWLLENWDGLLEWDDSNINKPHKHGLTSEEVESIFDAKTVFLGRIIEPEGDNWSEERFLTLGQTDTKKTVALIWTKRNTKLRAVTCRRMRNEEKNTFFK